VNEEEAAARVFEMQVVEVWAEELCDLAMVQVFLKVDRCPFLLFR